MRYILALTAAALLLASNALAKTTLDWWQFWTDPTTKPVIEKLVADFEKENPDIDVQLTDMTWANGHEKIVIAFSSGTGPDVVELGSDWIAQFAANGRLADISDEIAGDSTQYDGWDMSTWDGKVWGVPWVLGTRVIYANKDLLRRAGYDEDFAPVTFDQFREAVAKIDSLGPNIYGWGSNTAEKHRLYKKFMPFMWSFGGQVFSDDMRLCVLPSMYTVAAVKYYKDLHENYGFVADQRGIEDAFLDGKVGFVLSGDWLLKRIRQEKRRLNFNTTIFPGTELPGRSFKGGEFLSVNAASDQKAAAMKLIHFITSPENQLKFCTANESANPSSKVAQKDPYFTEDPNLLTFIRQLRLSKAPPVTPQWVEIETIIEEAVEDILFNGADPIADRLLDARYEIERVMKE